MNREAAEQLDVLKAGIQPKQTDRPSKNPVKSRFQRIKTDCSLNGSSPTYGACGVRSLIGNVN